MLSLRYVQAFRDRHGHWRYYYRRQGFPRAVLPGRPGSPEFMAAYHAAGASAPPHSKAKRNPNMGSVYSAVSLYLGSAVFNALAAETRRTRRNILERFREQHGDKRIAKLSPEHVQRMVDAKAGTPSAARNFLNTLSAWLKWCAREGIITRSPVVNIERTPIRTMGYMAWPEEYVRQYRARWPLGTRERLALELLVGTGAARVDVVAMGRQHVHDGLLIFRREKTDVPVEIPILPELQDALDAMPRSHHLTFLTTARGQPFSPAVFGMWFRKHCDAAGIPVGYSAHGVRKYAATDRANRGATTHELMAWFGWLTVREAERYTRTAARRKLALGMAERLRS